MHYSPVRHSTATKSSRRNPSVLFPFDLHVLSMPPAFNLSQDQTLQFNHTGCLRQPILAQLRIFGIEDASLIFLAVSDHQRSTHTNYLIELLKSGAPSSAPRHSSMDCPVPVRQASVRACRSLESATSRF